MIISDMTYQINAVESKKVEGGFDLGAAITDFTGHYSAIYTGSSSSPAGSYTYNAGLNSNVNTNSLSVLGVDLAALGVGPGPVITAA